MKAYDTVNNILLLAAATASDRETYSKLVTTVTSLMANLLTENKNLVAELRDNAHI